MGSKALVCLWGLLLTLPVLAMADSIRFNIAAQPLPTALKTFAAQANMQLLYRFEVVKSATVNAVVGDFDKREALEMLLNGTGLEAVYSKDDAATIRPAKGASRPAASNSIASTTTAVSGTNGETRLAQADPPSSPSTSAPSTPSRNQNASTVDTDLGEIVVVGTNIRGVYPSSSPVQIYTAEDIARTGATTTEQFLQKLPQNLGTRTGFSPVNRTPSNREGVTSVDLRGLGVGTTLTLMNGRRLGLSSFGQATDISLIPVSAIARVEVLTDGASAIYGSDAVGGVVNFVLRDDFEGAETRLSYGGVTSGGLRQGDLTQTFGRAWGSGHGLVSLNYFRAEPLEGADRAFAAPAGPAYLTPDDERYAALATFSQDIGERWGINGDLVFSRRDVRNFASTLVAANPLQHFASTNTAETRQYFANLGVKYRIGSALNGSVLASYSKVDVGSLQISRFLNTSQIQTFIFDTDHAALDLTAVLDGTLFSLPAGGVRFSVGGGRLDEQYGGALTIQFQAGNSDLGRATNYGFAEVLVPLIGKEQDVPWIERFELSLAARYTSFADTSRPALGRDFGDDTVPKIGILWGLTSALDLRGTYGESFRAPSLVELDPANATSTLRQNRTVGGVGGATTLLLNGPSTSLDPETAKSYTLGFDFHPAAYPGFRLSATYFNIDYQDRLGQANVLAGTANPASAPEAVYRPTSAAQIEAFLRSTVNALNDTGIDLADPQAAAAAVFARPSVWIQDSRFRNLALSKLDGIDLGVTGEFETRIGTVSAGAQLTRVFEYQQQDSPTAPVLSVVDTLLRPVSLRGRTYVGLVRGGLASTIGLNYVDDYLNPLPAGARKIDSWTTVDWTLGYDFGISSPRGQLDGLRLTLSVQNLLDEDPPFINANLLASLTNPSGFDPANANPVGRLVVLGLSARW